MQQQARQWWRQAAQRAVRVRPTRTPALEQIAHTETDSHLHMIAQQALA